MKPEPKLVILSGAGVSAESGIKTFRDADGLWEGHDIMEVATPEGFKRNPALVLDFYNQRRKQAKDVVPNSAHKAIALLEEKYDVTVITQNVDNLHERAGSTKVIHLHGELMKCRSTLDPNLIFDIEGDILVGDQCPRNSQLRPHIVWFGEAVPEIERAAKIVNKAEIVIIIGTSMVVYPAAGLIDYAQNDAQIYVIDPNMPYITPRKNLHLIEATATKGMSEMIQKLL